MIGFFRLVLITLLLVVVAMTSAVVTMHFAIHGAEVPVPDLHGMSVGEAGRRAAALGLRIHVENHLYSAEVPPGRVANQSPAAGVIVRRGWRVWLTESLGAQKLAIPDVKGKDQRIAAIEIRRADMQTAVTATMPWPEVQPGTVIAQSPEADAPGVASPVVNLLIAAPASGPPQPNGWVMPNFEGQLFTSAAYAVTRMGLHLDPVKEEESPTQAVPDGSAMPMQPAMPSGTVIGQEPSAGFRVDASVPVTFTVAK